MTLVLTGRTAVLALLGVVAVGLLVAAGAGPVTALVTTNVVIVAVVAWDFARAGSPRALSLSRRGDHRVRLGEEAVVLLDVHNGGRRRWRGVLRDAWAPTAGATLTGPDGQSGTGPGTDRAVVDLPPGQSVTLRTQVRPTRRGDRPADRITMRAYGPLGVAARQRSLTLGWSVRTLPPFTSRRHLPSRLARLRDLDGRQAIAVRAQGTEFDSLREYVPGDDVRAIDWRASARATDVMVRTWRPERDRRVVIVLDTGRTSAARVGDETRLDVSMDAALLLAALAGRAGDRVDLIGHDRRSRVQVSARAGSALLPDLVDALATLEPELTQTDYRGMVAGVLARVRKRALVVLLVSLDRAALEEGLLPALPTLTARHTVILAAVGERPATPHPGAADSVAPDLVAPSSVARGGSDSGGSGSGGSGSDRSGSDRRDVADTYQAAAAARTALDRTMVRGALTRLGVVVVDAEPDTLAPRLADAYLDLKAAGRL